MVRHTVLPEGRVIRTKYVIKNAIEGFVVIAGSDYCDPP